MHNADTDTEVTGLLLAGGRSSRMGGREKALLDIGGEPMLIHVLARLRPQVGRIAINANGDPARFSGHGLPVISDTITGYAGPLAGLHAGMTWAKRETPDARFIASVPIDSPFVPFDLVAQLKAALFASNAPCAIASSNGERYPVAGLWRIELADALGAALNDNVRALHRFADMHSVTVVDFPPLQLGDSAIDPFFNVNSPADLEKARALFAAQNTEPTRG